MRKMLRKALLLSLMILTWSFASAKHAPNWPVQKKSKEIAKMNQSSPEDRFAQMDPRELPAIVPISPENRAYLIFITERLRDVIERKKPLDEVDPIFGKGEFFWPKVPGKPIKTALTFGAANFKFKSIQLDFNRNDAKGAWETAVLSVNPRNFPNGVYAMDLPESFFSDLTLLRAYSEEREHESITKVNVFEFVPRQHSAAVRLKFESRADVSSTSEKYPRSFHALFITSTK